MKSDRIQQANHEKHREFGQFGRGLYLITSDAPWAELWPRLEVALATGAVQLLQYRRKLCPADQQQNEILQLLPLCQQAGVPLIINDSIDLAAQYGCGVHLGQGDGSVQDARQRLGAKAIIGRTCQGSLTLARQAAADGADYIALGAAYPSLSKPEAQPMNRSIIREARLLGKPVCVIGGLTVENAGPVLAAGADLCAVIGDVLSRPTDEVAARVQAWQQLFARSSL